MFPKITKLLTSTVEEDQILGFLLLKKYKPWFNILKWFEWFMDLVLIIPFIYKILAGLGDYKKIRISSIEFIYLASLPIS